MARTNAGAAWTGWALMAGLPATLGLLFVNLPLALIVGAATFVAWKVGSSKEAEEDWLERSERLRLAQEEEARGRHGGKP